MTQILKHETALAVEASRFGFPMGADCKRMEA